MPITRTPNLQIAPRQDLEAKPAAPLLDYRPPANWTRKHLRSMGLVAQYAVDNNFAFGGVNTPLIFKRRAD